MSVERSTVSNTGPLITLEKITGGFDFIRLLYDKLIIPPVVLDEIAQGEFQSGADYLKNYNIVDLIEIRSVTQHCDLPEIERIHEGEKQAIWLALELKKPLLIEETVGRRVAQNIGLSISGIAGQIVLALSHRIISKEDANLMLIDLYNKGRINRRIYETLSAAVTRI
jgi:predicted nucleic acid-binding protein